MSQITVLQELLEQHVIRENLNDGAELPQWAVTKIKKAIHKQELINENAKFKSIQTGEIIDLNHPTFFHYPTKDGFSYYFTKPFNVGKIKCKQEFTLERIA